MTDPPASGVPRRGNAFSHWLGTRMLHAMGWRIDGVIPDRAKLVAIVAPHTSNWDFPLGVAALFALRVDPRFLAKHTLFRPPFGSIMRWLGGIPVNRSCAHDVVEQIIARFNTTDRLLLAITPEGTRKRVARWRTGFYFIAHGARAPIVPIAFDWGTHTIRIGMPVNPTGDLNADMAVIAAFYAGARGRRHELASPA